MIKYNLAKESYKNHELDHKWAKLHSSPIYRNNLCTVVDNSREVVNNKYTHEQSTLLLHLSPDVRRYVKASVFDEFLYVGVWCDEHVPTYTNWDYDYKILSNEEVIESLFSILYELEPALVCRTLAGGSKDPILDEHNSYWGEYVLNDEEVYKIHRSGDNIRFTKGSDDNYVEIYKGKLDVDRFKKAYEVYLLKDQICKTIDMLIAEGDALNKILELLTLKNAGDLK